MTRFAGYVGFGEQTETSPGVWQDVVVERLYYGDLVKMDRTMATYTQHSQSGTQANFTILSTNNISILADAYANDSFNAMRYVRWSGSLWIVASVQAQPPRLILTLGGVYNGPTPATS